MEITSIANWIIIGFLIFVFIMFFYNKTKNILSENKITFKTNNNNQENNKEEEKIKMTFFSNKQQETNKQKNDIWETVSTGSKKLLMDTAQKNTEQESPRVIFTQQADDNDGYCTALITGEINCKCPEHKTKQPSTRGKIEW